MRALIGITLMILPFLGHAFAQGSSVPPGSIRGDVFAKGTNREAAVLSEAQIALRPQLMPLNAMACAFSRKVHHA
jgi:hypothetical protein